MTAARRISLSKPVFDEEMKNAAIFALQSERFVLGESVYKFEEEFAHYCGTEFAVSTASGTAALTLVLLALNIRGDVLTTPASFVATANSIIHANATPKFVDIALDTYTIDPAKLPAAINMRTKAVLPVHLYGFPASMDEISEMCSHRGISIVEDACQAHGALYKGMKVGSIGDVGCFSFYPSKNMTVAGDGGMVVTSDDKIAESVQSLRDCGRVKGKKYLHNRVGFTERLNTVQAAIGRVQLRRLDLWNEKRRQVASAYDKLFSDIDIVRPPVGSNDVVPVYHTYVIRCEQREELRKWLEQHGVQTGVHYEYPIHLQPAYQGAFGYREGDFKNSEMLCRTVLSIPMYPELALDDVAYISDCIHRFYERSVQS